MDRLLVDCFLEAYDEAPAQIWLDLGATDDPIHGHAAAGASHESAASAVDSSTDQRVAILIRLFQIPIIFVSAREKMLIHRSRREL